jgi:hypothetical protein
MRLVYAALLFAVTASPAFAQREPVIVIPGRPDVPVYINGMDASWAVVEGEFGLDRPGVTTPVVTYRPLTVSVPYAAPGYFPHDNRQPGYGRLEIEPSPNRAPPPPAPSFFQSWSSQSQPGPVTQYAPFGVPAAVVGPRVKRNRWPSNGHNAEPNHEVPNATNQKGP